jgi:hypothetical protein
MLENIFFLRFRNLFRIECHEARFITRVAKATNIPLYTIYQSEHGETVFCVDLAANRFFFDSLCSKSGV